MVIPRARPCHAGRHRRERADIPVPGGMGGLRCAAALRELAPDVPLVLMSGSCDDSALSEPERHSFRAVLPKPFCL